MWIAAWVGFESVAVVAGIAYIILGASTMSEAEKIIVPILIGTFWSDIFTRLRAGADYLRILWKLLGLAITGKPLRISFATLIRIQSDNQYLLVRSKRINQQFQPTGGVIKFYDQTIKGRFQLKDDNSFPNQDGDELRLQFEPKTVWSVFAFLKWFDSRLCRELSPDREFVEELIEPQLLPESLFAKPRFAYVKRVIPKITYGTHFKVHELFLFEIFELVPTDAQKQHLKLMTGKTHSDVVFLTADSILRDGYDGKATTKLGSQTKYIL